MLYACTTLIYGLSSCRNAEEALQKVLQNRFYAMIGVEDVGCVRSYLEKGIVGQHCITLRE